MVVVNGLTNDHALLLERAGTINTNPVSVYGLVNSAYWYLLETISTSPTTASKFWCCGQKVQVQV
jgi:hypothetical protein